MYRQLTKVLLGLLSFLAVTFIIDSCKHEPEIRITSKPADTTGNPIDTTQQGNPCSPDTVYFEKDILPLLLSNCAKSGCHDPITKVEGIVLTDYTNTMASGRIIPGNPLNSDLYDAITETDPKKVMPPPPHAPLTSDQKELLRKWIAQGAQNLKCNSGCDTLNVKWTSHISTIINNNCKGCHSGTAPSGNVSLTDYASVKSQALSGKLIGVVRQDVGFKPMPPYGSKPLSACNITAIRKWIENGMQE